jgi:hypothetical protein
VVDRRTLPVVVVLVVAGLVLTRAGEIALGRVVAATRVWVDGLGVRDHGRGRGRPDRRGIGELADAMLAGGVERPIARVSGDAGWSSGCWP